jgi:hypothetical protein
MAEDQASPIILHEALAATLQRESYSASLKPRESALRHFGRILAGRVNFHAGKSSEISSLCD